MISLDLKQISDIKVSYEETTFTKEDFATLATVFSNPSVIKYLKHLEQEIISSLYKIPLDEYLKNKEEYVMKQVFVKGTLNVTQTLLNIHKDTPQK